MLKKLTLVLISFFIIQGTAKAVSATFSTGSYIINMGVVPQTQANALKPYGLVYDLLKNYKVPVYWVISDTKAKDGIDFTYGGTDYKGGTFIIPAEFMSATIIARVTFFGVTKTVTTSALTVDYTYKLTSAPKWTLDAQNGSIAASWFPLAGVPATAYNWKTPATLGSCDDIFVMPHADPIWATHGNLYDWNRNYFGSIWAGCHAVSVLENMNDGSSKQTNFLANNVGSIGNALVLWTGHSGATVPYTHNHPTFVGGQYMGITDNAHLNGSEQVYLPKTGGGWRATTKIIAYDPTQSNVPTLSGGPAGIILMGRGFGLNSAGWVMYEAGHDISKLGVGSGSQSIAAMRAFWDFSFVSSQDKVPAVSAATVPSPILVNTDNAVSITASSPVGLTLSYQWTATLNGVATGTFASATSATTTFRTSTAGNYIITYTITDACGRVTFVSTPVTVNTVATPTVAPDALTLDPGCTGSATGSINVLSNDTDPLGGTLTITGIDTSSTPRRGSITSWTSAGVINYTANLSRSGPGTQTINYTAHNASGNTTGTLTITVGTGSAPSASNYTFTLEEDSIGRFNVVTVASGLTVKAITSSPTRGKVSINLNNQITYIPNGDNTTSDVFTYQVVNAAGNTATGTVTVNFTANSCDGGANGSYMSVHPTAGSTTFNPSGDTYMSDKSGDENKNYGANTTFKVDQESGKTLRALLKFDISSLSGKTVTTSNVRLRATSAKNNTAFNISVHEVTQNWTEGTGTGTANTSGTFLGASWNNPTTWNVVWTSGVGGSFNSSMNTQSVTTGSPTDYTWTLTPSVVQGWTTGSNFGILFKFVTDNTGGNEDKTFASREDGTSANRPLLTVNYLNAATCAANPARPPLTNPDYFTVVNGTSNNTYSAATNDFMPSGGTNTYSIYTNPASGTASINSSSGLITYTPSTSFNGTRSFAYIVSNTLGGNDTAYIYVTITNGPIVAVNDAPTAANSGVTQTVTVTGNDSDPEGTIGANTHVVSISVQPEHGTATVNGSKQIVYVPTTGYSGTDVLTYSLCEPTPGCGVAACSTATVTFTITNQPPPTPGTSNVAVNLCTPKTINLIGLVTDPEGSTLTISALSALSDPTKGTLVNNNDGTVTFTPTVGASAGTGITSFTFSLTDGTNTVNGTVSLDFIDPTPTNAAPNAVKDNPESFTMNTVLFYEVRGNDSDPEGQDLSVPTIVNNPSNGTVTIEASGLIKYTPTNNYVGTDVFRYRIYDRVANSSTCALSDGLPDTADVRIIVSAAPITLSGNVYNDLNALIGSPSNTIDGTGIGSLSSTPLYVYLVNGSNNVVDAAQVNEDGTFLFNNVTGSTTYSLRISTTAANVGDAAPTVTLPSDWVNTGEYNGSGAGNDGTANGILPSIAVTTTSISTLKFGVEQRPSSSTITAITQGNPGGTTQVTLPSTTFGGTDPSAGGAIASIRITAYPTASSGSVTSFVANGVTYVASGGDNITTFNFPASGILVSTNSVGEPTTAITFDPSSTGATNITFVYKTRDTARFESTAAGSAIQPLSASPVVNLSGRVYNDVDGNANNINNLSGLGNPAGATLYANLVDHTTQVVVATVAVAANGTYSFASVANGTYDVQLSTNQGIVSSAKPATVLPDGWVNTGEYQGTGTTDGSVDGLNTGTSASGIVVSGSSIADLNFGIEKIPTPLTETAASVVNPGGTNTVTVPATVFSAIDANEGTIASIKITTFPTNTTTITINGTPYNSGNWPIGGVSIPTNSAGEPTQTILLDPTSGAVTPAITYKATDNAGKESTETGTAYIPFYVIGISGYVLNDADGLVDNLVDGDGLGNPAATTLHANLLNGSNVVIATTVVNADGSYSFAVVDPGTYKVQISTNQGTVSQTAPATNLPGAYVATGENIGISSGNDGTPDGTLTGITLTDADLANANFGIDSIPIAYNKTFTNLDPANFTTASGDTTYSAKIGFTAASGTANGAVNSSSSSNMPGKLSGTDSEDGKYGGSTGSNTGTVVFPHSGLPDSTYSMLVYTPDTTPILLVPTPTISDPSYVYWDSINSRYEIPNFDSAKFELFFIPGVSNSFSFTYGFMDAAGKVGNIATYSMSGNNPLPVKLINFTASKLNGADVLVKWVTASEVNNSHFNVERSADGRNWVTLGTVQGNGTTTFTHTYSFIDSNPLSVNYYRLKQVDFNGAFIYSPIRLISFEKIINNVVVYPNPTTDRVNISLNSSAMYDAITIQVTDMTGRLVLQNKYSTETNKVFETSLSLKDLDKGYYQITISNDSFTKTVKVLKY